MAASAAERSSCWLKVRATTPSAVLAAQKLVNQDRFFLMADHIGTAHNNAAMPVQFEKNVISYLPITAAREVFEPFHKLKYAFAATYFDPIRTALPSLMKQKGSKKVCTLYEDDEFGLEVKRGAEAALKAMGQELVKKTSYKRGATDFSSQLAKMKAAGCDLVVLGTIIRQTIGAIGESRKTGFNPPSWDQVRPTPTSSTSWAASPWTACTPP